MIDDCRRRLALPRFDPSFRERTQEAWAAFSKVEAQLRQLLDVRIAPLSRRSSSACVKQPSSRPFLNPAFEVGHNGQKYELILTPEGNLARLYELVYFQRHAPAELLEHWNFPVGRQASANFSIRTAAGMEISGQDVRVLPEKDR